MSLREKMASIGEMMDQLADENESLMKLICDLHDYQMLDPKGRSTEELLDIEDALADRVAEVAMAAGRA